VFDAARGTTTPLPTPFWGLADVVAFSPDGAKLAVVSGQFSSDVNVLEAKTGRLARRIRISPPNEGGSGAGCAAWAPDSDTLYVVTGKTIAGLSTRSGARTARVEHPRLAEAPSRCTAKVSHGTLLILQSSLVLRLRLPALDAPTEHAFPFEGSLPDIAPDGQSVVLSDDKGASILDTSTWSLRSLPGASGAARYAPTSALVAIGLGVWDVHTAGRIATLPSAL
jgi:hypothetical protein